VIALTPCLTDQHLELLEQISPTGTTISRVSDAAVLVTGIEVEARDSHGADAAVWQAASITVQTVLVELRDTETRVASIDVRSGIDR
jgi:hypothetical protein